MKLQLREWTARLVVSLGISMLLLVGGCASDQSQTTFVSVQYPLERAGVPLFLQCTRSQDKTSTRQILLVHGLTYSSHQFDVEYEDYSLVRKLASAGFSVWIMDIAGYGRSGAVANGFTPDSDYAALDIAAAVDRIVALSGEERIDLLGWSWGTVTSSRYAAAHPERLRHLVLYAPILSGLGAEQVTEPFNHNNWVHRNSDFQMTSTGDYDFHIVDPQVLHLMSSLSWRYDGEFSPNGGRRDLLVSPQDELINLKAIKTPTLVIVGDHDPYIDYARLKASPDKLPAGSRLEIIPGAAHMAMVEKPFYHDFQNRLLRFLDNEQ